MAGVEGQLSLEEGQSGDTLVMTDRNQLTTVWAQHDKRLRSVLTFEPGPADWPEGTTLRLGAVGGVQLEVLKYLPPCPHRRAVGRGSLLRPASRPSNWR